MRAFDGEPLRDRSADAGAGARYDCDFSAEPRHVILLS
jgi:hypothetical protein